MGAVLASEQPEHGIAAAAILQQKALPHQLFRISCPDPNAIAVQIERGLLRGETGYRQLSPQMAGVRGQPQFRVSRGFGRVYPAGNRANKVEARESASWEGESQRQRCPARTGVRGFQQVRTLDCAPVGPVDEVHLGLSYCCNRRGPGSAGVRSGVDELFFDVLRWHPDADQVDPVPCVEELWRRERQLNERT